MKKGILSLLCAVCAAVALCACSTAPSGEADSTTSTITTPLSVGEASCVYGASATEGGDQLVITLDENPTTGYVWSAALEGSCLTCVSDRYEETSVATALSGAGGAHTFTYRTANPGTAVVTLTYARPWEGGEQGDVVRYIVTVDVGKVTDVQVEPALVDPLPEEQPATAEGEQAAPAEEAAVDQGQAAPEQG